MGRDREGGHAARPMSRAPLTQPLTRGTYPTRGGRKRAEKTPAQKQNAGQRGGVGGAGPREAGGPHGPRHRQRVGSQGGMPTRSSPEAGLAGDEYLKEPPPACC